MFYDVLTIDWDYFMNVSFEDRLRYFPDGGNENIPTSIKNTIWASRYANASLSGYKMQNIGLLGKDLGILKRYLNKVLNWNNKKVYVAESHKDVYKVIKEVCGNKSPYRVVNIDHHHDYYGVEYGESIERELTCGNWALKLLRETNMKSFTWVCNKDSEIDKDLESYIINRTQFDKTMDFNYYFRKDKVYDIIFLCRSDVWSLPHLDKEFIELVNLLESKVNLRYKDRNIEIDRYKNMKKEIGSYEKSLKELKESLKR